MAPKVVSLFAGIGGFDLGLERAGFEVVRQVEIDPFCLKVLEKHWPGVDRGTDIRKEEPERYERHYGTIDVICGGFPCQDISFVGAGAGLSGSRSGLWREMVRAVRLARPKFVIVENVAALLNRGMGEVLGDLAESGFDSEWDCIPAAVFGAPHLRFRTFIVAHADGIGLPGRQDSRSCFEGGTLGKEQPSGLLPSSFWVDVSAPEVSGMDDGVPFRMDRNRVLGNAVVPQEVEWIGKRIKAVLGKEESPC